MNDRIKKLKAVLFDMDGTIVDVPYDWEKIRKKLNTGGMPVLAYLDGLSEPERTQKWKILEEIENKATSLATMKKGMKALFSFLRDKKIKIALITNNSKKNLAVLMNRFHLSFDLVLTREEGLWKPSGKPFLYVLEKLGIGQNEACVVGDSRFDIIAAKDAGISRIFIFPQQDLHSEFKDVVMVYSVKELKHQLEKWI